MGIELEGLEGLRFEPAQYQALADLCQALARRYPIAHVAGHEHIAPGRKLDPGPGFDWARLRHATRWPANRFPLATAAEQNPAVSGTDAGKTGAPGPDSAATMQ